MEERCSICHEWKTIVHRQDMMCFDCILEFDVIQPYVIMHIKSGLKME